MKIRAAAGAVLVLVGLTITSGAVSGTANADPNCGGTITKKSRPDYREWKMTWTNCGSVSSRKKVDIAWAPDTDCVRIPAGSSYTWTHATAGADPSHPRGFKNC